MEKGSKVTMFLGGMQFRRRDTDERSKTTIEIEKSYQNASRNKIMCL